MSLTGTLNTALAGLQVTQQALQLVGGNVANAQTPGYVRKTLNQVQVAAANTISVRTTSITRSLDAIIQSQLRQETSGGAYAGKLSELYKQLQALYGAPGSTSAIDTLFGNFTSALQTLANSPNSSSAQSSAVNAAHLLAQQLNSMSDNIQGMRSAAEQGIAADVQKANDALQQIAKINTQIASATAIDPTTATLMDQRDKYIDDLSKLMDIRVVKGDFNQVMVYTGSGFQLVGTQAATLSFNAQGTLTPDALYNVDPTKSGVGILTMTSPNGSAMDLIAAGAIKSGEIAAYLQMRDQILPQAQAQLDELAAQMSQAASDLTTAGTAVSVGTQNGFTLDTAGLKNGNVIHLTYTDGTGTHNISLVRVDDASVLPLPDSTTPDPNDRVIGIDFSGGMAAVVSQLTIALGGTGLQFANPSGNVLRVLNNPANTVTVNALSQTTTLTSLASGNSQVPLFMDGTSYYTGAITPTGSQQRGYAQRIVVNGALFANPAGMVNYSAAPATLPGDSARPDFLYGQMTSMTFTYSPATGLGGAASPMQGTLTTYIGQVLTQQAQNAANADALKQGQDVVVNSLQQRMSSISEVNIDAEMAALLTLQNTYAANARVFSTVQQMYQSLLQM
jgi:flagellar hook-associated protein 1 FlgK